MHLPSNTAIEVVKNINTISAQVLLDDNDSIRRQSKLASLKVFH